MDKQRSVKPFWVGVLVVVTLAGWATGSFLLLIPVIAVVLIKLVRWWVYEFRLERRSR